MENYGYQNEYDFVELFNKKHLNDLILSKKCLEYTSPHVGCMTIGPKKRNVDGNSRYWDEKYIVCVRWNFIREDIVNFKKSTIVS